MRRTRVRLSSAKRSVVDSKGREHASESLARTLKGNKTGQGESKRENGGREETQGRSRVRIRGPPAVIRMLVNMAKASSFHAERAAEAESPRKSVQT